MSSCIHLLFTTNNKLLCDVGAEQTIIINVTIILYLDHLSQQTFLSTLLYGSLVVQKHRSDMYTECNFINELEWRLQ